MSTTLHSCGTLVIKDEPALPPNLLTPDGRVDFVACAREAGLDVERTVERVRNTHGLASRFANAMDIALAQAEAQRARFGKSQDEVALMDLRDRALGLPYASRMDWQQERELRRQIAEREAKIAGKTVLTAEAA